MSEHQPPYSLHRAAPVAFSEAAIRFAAPVLFSTVITSCANNDTASWKATTEHVGDTTVVHTMAGQVWPTARTAVVELSIGSLSAPATSFGFIAGLAVNSAGDVFVYDWQVPVIRQFDQNGEFVRQVGAAGKGPGEYTKPIIGLAVRSDGRLQVGDISNRRITLFNPDGTVSAMWPVLPPSALPTLSMFVDSRDHTFVRTLSKFVTATEFESAIVHIDPNGTVVDTTAEPIRRWPAATDALLSAAKVTAYSPNFGLMIGVNDRYEFDVFKSDGRVLRIQRDRPPVQIGDEEHIAYEAWREYMANLMAKTKTPVRGQTPRTKPVYRSLHFSSSGDVWVRLYAEGQKKANYVPAPPGAEPVSPFFEPTEFDVFDPEGRYLGPVHIPDEISVIIFGDEVLWGWRTGAQGEPQVVRMRLSEQR
jgi:hypothetical protein